MSVISFEDAKIDKSLAHIEQAKREFGSVAERHGLNAPEAAMAAAGFIGVVYAAMRRLNPETAPEHRLKIEEAVRVCLDCIEEGAES